MRSATRRWFCATLLLFHSSMAMADVFYELPLRDAQVLESSRHPLHGGLAWMKELGFPTDFEPLVLLDGPGEAQASFPDDASLATIDSLRLAVRAPRSRDVTGWLAAVDGDLKAVVRVRFKIDAELAGDHAAAFRQVKQRRLLRLSQSGAAGAAWHKAQLREGQATDDAGKPDAHQQLMDAMELFSGGRAVTDSLQLDRKLDVAGGDGSRVAPVESIEGVSAASVDLSPPKDAQPELDPLANRIPHDQYAVFFPSFTQMLRVTDEYDEVATQLTPLWEPGGDDPRVGWRYRRQLCTQVTDLDRALGPKLIASVAATASDPFVREGADAAMLFEAKNTPAVVEYLKAKQTMAKAEFPDARVVRGKELGVEFEGVRTPDRAVCSYLFTLGDVVTVTNSRRQMRRLIESAQGHRPAVATLKEYRFFRGRYRRGAAESGLLVYSQDAVRRLASPRWRIAASRRRRALAELERIQARAIEALAEGKKPERPSPSDLGDVSMGPRGVQSSVYGTLGFCTPISELEVERVTLAEAGAYRRWRDAYLRDRPEGAGPLAMSFTVGEQRLTADITVVTGAGRGAYRQIAEFAHGAAIDPRRLHAGPVLLQAAAAVNRRNATMHAYDELSSLLLGIKKPLGWLDATASLRLEDGPLWRRLAATDDPRRLWRRSQDQIPFTIHLGSVDHQKLVSFLHNAGRLDRHLFSRIIPRETRRHRGRRYTKVAENFLTGNRRQPLYLAATPRELIVAVSEESLHQAMDRAYGSGEDRAAAPAWDPPGKHLAARAGPRLFELVRRHFRDHFNALAQLRSWNNLHALNDWKRLFPEQDPLELHQKYWQAAVVCPGGGRYVWDEKWKTMRSTVFGHPFDPRQNGVKAQRLQDLRSIESGVSFEPGALRGRAAVERVKRQ